MGITINYRGSIKDIGLIDQLQKEMVDICEAMNWEYQLCNGDQTKPCDAKLVHKNGHAAIEGHIPLRGIIINVDPEDESLDLLFNPQGNLSSFMLEIFKHDGTFEKDYNWIFVKTQFGAVESHIAIVKLLRYLKQTYIPDLEVHDEGDYWETGDKERLMGKRGVIFGAMAQVEKALSSLEAEEYISTEELIEKIEEVLRGMQNKRKR